MLPVLMVYLSLCHPPAPFILILYTTAMTRYTEEVLYIILAIKAVPDSATKSADKGQGPKSNDDNKHSGLKTAMHSKQAQFSDESHCTGSGSLQTVCLKTQLTMATKNAS